MVARCQRSGTLPSTRVSSLDDILSILGEVLSDGAINGMCVTYLLPRLLAEAFYTRGLLALPSES